MSKIIFNKTTMDLIQLFDTITGANTLDCVIMNDRNPDGTDGPERIIYMVERKDLSKAIGKNGVNVKKLREKLDKNIDIIAYSKDLIQFIRNLLYPVKILDIKEQKRNDGKRVFIVDVRPQDKGLAIGKNGRNIYKANFFVKRHFGVDGVIINTNN